MNDDLISRRALHTSVALFMAENAYLNMTALDTLKMMAKWIEEAPSIEAPTAQPETGWISVKDRLPEGDELVLAIANGKPQKNITLKSAYVLAEYIADDGWILDLWPMWKHAKVTHWMPLPRPPKEG